MFQFEECLGWATDGQEVTERVIAAMVSSIRHNSEGVEHKEIHLVSGLEEPATGKNPLPKLLPHASDAEDSGKLLESANSASGPARNAWLAFLGLLTYLLVTLAGVTHVDLLLNNPVTLPIVNVNISLFGFFVVAPFLFLLVHLGLLVQHAILAQKYQHFSAAISKSEERQPGNHPSRRLVHSYVFSQLLVGPQQPWPLLMLMRLMVFFTLSLLPVVVLLYFQIKFLPSHDVAITHAHRLAILLDLSLLFIVQPYFAMPFLRPRGARIGFGRQFERWEISYASLGLAGSLSLVVIIFSLTVATVPHGCFWPWGERPEEQENNCFSLDRTMAQLWAIGVKSGAQTREVFAPTKLLFDGEPNETTSAPDSLFSRNLVVTNNSDLVKKTDFDAGETSVSLRGRDLRFASFDRSDFRRVDLFKSDLRGISANGTQFEHANFEGAHLQSAELIEARLQGAILNLAHLEGAVLSLARLQGAKLRGAILQGADLELARLLGADLEKAKLQGANLREAQLQGARLNSTELQATNLSDTQLLGTDLTGSDVSGADLSGARVWRTRPPLRSTRMLPMPMLPLPLEVENIAPPSPKELIVLKNLLTEVKNEVLLERLKIQLRGILDTDSAPDWKSSTDHKAWTEISSSRPNAAEFLNYVTGVACRDGRGGYVIEAIANRLIRAGSGLVGQKAYADLDAAKLLNKENCPAAKHLAQETQELLLIELHRPSQTR